MAKRVNFYTVELYEKESENVIDYQLIKEKIIYIINKNANKTKNFLVLDLTRDSGLHYIADIFEYEGDKLFMRVSNQKPSGGFLHRNYITNVPGSVIRGKSEDKEGIEVYTYALLDYKTGIFSIVNQQSAPNYKVINNIFLKYNKDFFIKFIPIPNENGIARIYNSKKPKITQIEVEVPVPDAYTLETLFGWKAKEILNIQGHQLKATMKLSGMDRRTVTDNEDESRGLIDCIREKISTYNKAKIRAKADGVKTRDYSFFDENFSYPIEIPTYSIVSGQKHYLSANELVTIYWENLSMSYNENKHILKTISNR